VAQRLLADWDVAVERFGKVMPRDYKGVLAAMARAERDGLDVNKTIMAAAHG
jgi:glutamate synthase (NADPH/NADH) large chain